MLKSNIERLRKYILTTNPYFSEGLANVYLDPENGIANENGVVFPDDTRGNYFYLRLPDNVTFANGFEFSITECLPGLGINAQIVLVAIVNNADEDKLLQNLVNTIQSFGNYNKTFQTAIYKKEVVVRQELSWMTPENLSAVLQRLPDSAIVSVTFTLINEFIFNDCIIDPCSC